MLDPDELETAIDLLRDFRTGDHYSAEELIKVSWERFHALESNIFEFSSSPIQSVDQCEEICRKLHRILFVDFYSNAGEYRKATDPNEGKVFFGGNYRFQTQTFEGDSPSEITTNVRIAFESLLLNSDPVKHAVEFFQKFIKVHPFYDANGRIGRLMANIYLYQFQLVINWGAFDSENKFFKKLNKVHSHKSRLGYLVNYVRDYTSAFGFEDEY